MIHLQAETSYRASLLGWSLSAAPKGLTGGGWPLSHEIEFQYCPVI
jgi:hypothetical protein